MHAHTHSGVTTRFSLTDPFSEGRNPPCRSVYGTEEEGTEGSVAPLWLRWGLWGLGGPQRGGSALIRWRHSNDLT
jgi:hypothetical protein